jgi:hypothetical protein
MPDSPPSRRRSTVREPAPVALNGDAETPSAPPPPPQAAELPQPVVSETAEAADQPRRSGWWRKR